MIHRLVAHLASGLGYALGIYGWLTVLPLMYLAAKVVKSLERRKN